MPKTKKKSIETRNRQRRGASSNSTNTMHNRPTVVIQKATRHQGDAHFSLVSRGKQCTTMAFVAIAVSAYIQPHAWTPVTIDFILDIGDNLYKTFPHQQDYFDFDELPHAIHLTHINKSVAMSKETLLCGFLMAAQSSVDAYSLEDAIELGSRACTGCLLTACQFTIAVFMKDNKLYCFDSHARGSDGLVSPSGTAVLMVFADSVALATHIRLLYNPVPSQQFSLLFVNCHLSEPCLTQPQVHASVQTSAKIQPNCLETYFSHQLAQEENRCQKSANKTNKCSQVASEKSTHKHGFKRKCAHNLDLPSKFMKQEHALIAEQDSSVSQPKKALSNLSQSHNNQETNPHRVIMGKLRHIDSNTLPLQPKQNANGLRGEHTESIKPVSQEKQSKELTAAVRIRRQQKVEHPGLAPLQRHETHHLKAPSNKQHGHRNKTQLTLDENHTKHLKAALRQKKHRHLQKKKLTAQELQDYTKKEAERIKQLRHATKSKLTAQETQDVNYKEAKRIKQLRHAKKKKVPTATMR